MKLSTSRIALLCNNNNNSRKSMPMKAALASIAACALVGGCFSKTEVRKPVDPGAWAGPLAQKYAGKVVFSSEPILMNGTDDKGASSTITLGEPLFMQFWSEDSPLNLLPCRSTFGNEAATRRADYWLDLNGAGTGKPVTELVDLGGYPISDGAATQRHWHSLSATPEHSFASPFVIGATDQDEAVRIFNGQIVPAMHEGANTLRVVVQIRCASEDKSRVFAEGTLTVNVPPGGVAAYMATFADRLQPSTHPENAELVPQIIATVKRQREWQTNNIIAASVISPAWEPVRNDDTGVLTGYEIGAVVIMHAASEPNATRCQAVDFTFHRDAAGGSLELLGASESTDVACSAAKL